MLLHETIRLLGSTRIGVCIVILVCSGLLLADEPQSPDDIYLGTGGDERLLKASRVTPIVSNPRDVSLSIKDYSGDCSILLSDTNRDTLEFRHLNVRIDSDNQNFRVVSPVFGKLVSVRWLVDRRFIVVVRSSNVDHPGSYKALVNLNKKRFDYVLPVP
jgi:hypothetical protein